MLSRSFQTLCRVVVGLGLLASPLWAESPPQENIVTRREMLRVGIEPRAYTISYPNDLENRKRYPLIVAFHGYRGEVKTWFYEESGFVPLMAKEPFIIVYPEGPIQWETGANSPDVLFFDTLLDELKKKYPIDLNRIYVVGHSNGAVFSSYLLLRRPDVIAAGVAHSGLYPTGLFQVRENKPPLLVIWGEKDPMAPALSLGVQFLIAGFRDKGFAVTTLYIPDWGHPWAGSAHHIEEQVLAFLFAHHLAPATSLPKESERAKN